MGKVAILVSRNDERTPGGTLANELGVLRAEMAELKAREAEIVAKIKHMGPGVREGLAFRVTVSEHTGSTSLDVKAAEAKLRELGVDNRWFNRHMKTTAGSLRVTCSARRGE